MPPFVAVDQRESHTMSFINNLGMAQRLGAAGIIILLLALVLVKQRQKGAPKAKKADVSAVAKPGKRAKGRSAKAKPTKSTKAKKAGRFARRGKGDSAAEPELATPAVGRMVPRLPSSNDPNGGDAFAGALGPVGDDLAAPAAHNGAGPISEPGWPTPGNETWNATDAPADPVDAVPADATQPIEAVADSGAAEAGWATEEEMEGFDPATGWSESATDEAAEPLAEPTDWQTDDAADWTADDAGWETVADTPAPADEPAWTTSEVEEDTSTDWTPVAEEDAAEDAMLQWEPVEEPAVVEAEVQADVAPEPSFGDWSATDVQPVAEAPEPFSWNAADGAVEVAPAPIDLAPVTDMVEAPVFAPMADVAADAPFAGAALPTVESPMDTATSYRASNDDEPADFAPVVSHAPDVAPEPAMTAIETAPAFAVEPVVAEMPVVDLAPAAPIVTEMPVVDVAPVMPTVSVEPAVANPTAVAAPEFAVEPPAVAQPEFDREPIATTPAPVSPEPVMVETVIEVEPVMSTPVAPEPTLTEPTAELTFDFAEPRTSQVMSAPVVNPLDRWAGLAPAAEAAKPAINPVEAWSRMTPGPVMPRVGSLVEATAPVAAPLSVAMSVAAPAQPETANGASAWWDMPAGTEHNPRRGRFALGGYALKSGHQVVSGVTFREGIVPPPSDWVIGPVTGTVAPGTLVLEVDGCLNCRAEDLAVLMEPGFAPTTDGFSLRLSALEQGPFAASGNYVIY